MLEIRYDNVWAKCSGSRLAISYISEVLTCTVKGARYTNAYKMGSWNGKRCFYSIRSDCFPAGLVPYVTEYLDKEGIPYDLVDNRPPLIFTLEDPELSITLRDYQEAAVQALLKSERGVCKLPTRSGKTAVGIAVLKSLNLPSLFIVHQKGLAVQAVDEFRIGHAEVGLVGMGKWQPNKITVAMIQSLYSGLKTKNPKCLQLLESVNVFVIDEVHHCSASYKKVSREMRNARFRFGLSATPFMSGKENALETMGIVGPLVYENKMTKLIEHDRIVRPTVFFVRLGGVVYGNEWSEIYEEGIVKNKIRNRAIADIALKMLKKGKRPLILIEKIEHGKALLKLLKPKAKTHFVYGDDDITTRQNALKELQFGSLEVLISSRIFDEGQDIPHLECVIVAGGYKSAVRSYQRYGRGITKVPGKEETIIVDFLDLSHRILRRHSEERLALCKREKAFTVNVVKLEDL